MTGINFIFALIAGIISGLFYFGFLWLTVKRIPRVQRPLVWSFLSFMSRIFIIIIVFYFVINLGDWRHLLVTLLGFILIKFIMIHQISSHKVLKGEVRQ